ncbi:TOBE domain-containing protein [Dankookia sp. P2]|uniref:TOBE domain-containing protein n=1 Tax=Dankookia sp. P2 TaxID=3423955 RepID=UPI003D671658
MPTFLGEVNRLPARLRAGRAETPIGGLPIRPGADLAEGAVEVLLRPEGLLVQAEGGTPAEVEACRPLGATTLVHLRGGGRRRRGAASAPPGCRRASAWHVDSG